MSDAVRYEAADGIGVITFDRPDNRNSMTDEVLDAFVRATAQARASTDLRCIVITGSGATFSAGADFKALPSNASVGGGAPAGSAGGAGVSPVGSVQREEGEPHERSFAMYAPFLSVLELEIPVIGALNGHAIGGGFGLALICDIRIGARNAKYGANFVRLGLSPGMAISYLLPRIVGVSRAAEMMFTGRLIDGDEAERIGLVSECHAAIEVLPRAMALARTIAANAPLAVRATKANLYRGLDWNPRGHAAREAVDQAATLATADCAEGIAALLGKRVPVFTGR
jgi:enoyl-CoA hydratase/carnithine racemase